MTDSQLDFELCFAQLVTQLSNGIICGEQINAYDKIAIALQLAIMFVGNQNAIHYECPECSAEQQTPVITTVKYSITDILAKLQPTIDNNPTETVGCESGMLINLDVQPASGRIALERFRAHQQDVTNVGIFSWARSLVIKGSVLDFGKFEYAQLIEIFNRIAMAPLQKIREFASKHSASRVVLFPLKCANCLSAKDVAFTLSSINLIIHGVLRLNLDTIYRDIYTLSTNHIDNIYDLTPIERDVFKKIHLENQPKG